ncbi:hypothetical protein QYZ38_25910 [Vibrio parahaemolyticus]|nr:hypothetical protein [Vibrio parahaemolyticus]
MTFETSKDYSLISSVEPSISIPYSILCQSGCTSSGIIVDNGNFDETTFPGGEVVSDTKSTSESSLFVDFEINYNQLGSELISSSYSDQFSVIFEANLVRLHIILIFFLLLEPINSLASEGISLGLNAGSDFKDMDYIGLDVGYKNDDILFSLGFNKNTGNEVDFVSGIYYDLYRNSEFSLYFGSGLEDKNAFLSYGINYSCLKISILA